MNRMVVLDVLGDLMRLALQAVAHNVLAEQRNTILLALLHLHISHDAEVGDLVGVRRDRRQDGAQPAGIFRTSRRRSARSP